MVDDFDDLCIRLPISLCNPSTLKYAPAQRAKRMRLAHALSGRLDRVGVLGGASWGHNGCVNALSWAQDGELLISSGDDTNIRVWRMDSSGFTGSDTTSSSLQSSFSLASGTEESLNFQTQGNEYPFTCQTVISTGHTQNVFNAQMLPFSTRIATVSGDRQVRVFDVGEAVGRSPTGSEMSYDTRQSCIRVLRCHSGRAKRIITEDSPDLFLTIAEDGQVRQHDLRTSHSCTSGTCPAPLVELPHELSTIALSPLTPYQFVVGGQSPYAHLFDRRHAGRYLREEWGMSPDEKSATTCVRRFGRRSRAKGTKRGLEHVTGARLSAWNGHEVLLSYNSDAVYLYSTRDEPESSQSQQGLRSILTPNPKCRGIGKINPSSLRDEPLTDQDVEMTDQLDMLPADTVDAMDDYGDESVDEDEEESDEDAEDYNPADADAHQSVPVIYPRMRFTGHCNVETIKDVNFLGPHDEFVTSGSDDGNFFIWRKSTGELVDILEGDKHVVNVIEGHPHLPLVAVSGIDKTVKLFAPTRGIPSFSRWNNAETIKRNNAQSSSRRLNASAELQFTHLVLNYELALRRLRDADGDDSGMELTQCINQ